MRPDSPESPSPPPPRLPVIWSASSTKTITCPSACRIENTFSRLPSVAPTHLSRKFFSSTQGMPMLARQALDQVRLAGADAAREQVAHRDRHRAAALQQHRVLAQPRLGLVVARHVVERAGRLEELQAPGGLLLDQLLLHAREVGAGDALAARERAPHQRRAPTTRESPTSLSPSTSRVTSEAFANSSASGTRLEHVAADVVAAGQRHADLGAVGRLDQAAVEVGQVLASRARSRRRSSSPRGWRPTPGSGSASGSGRRRRSGRPAAR